MISCSGFCCGAAWAPPAAGALAGLDDPAPGALMRPSSSPAICVIAAALCVVNPPAFRPADTSSSSVATSRREPSVPVTKNFFVSESNRTWGFLNIACAMATFSSLLASPHGPLAPNVY
ncbi:MAG: hypothetical protein R2762_28925 [Bryobacteraceae bacterium]